MSIIYAAAGGAIGAAGRYLIGVMAFRLLGPGFPWATLTVNILGSFLMGLTIVVFALRFSSSQEMKTFLVTGILGGFTTFSTFSLDFATLLERKENTLALLYLGSSVVLSILGLFAGLALARQILN